MIKLVLSITTLTILTYLVHAWTGTLSGLNDISIEARLILSFVVVGCALAALTERYF